jgi:predicted small secreted protein
MPVFLGFSGENRLMRKLLVLLIATASVAVAACNTIAGAGKDVSATGNAVTDTAKDATPH